MIILSDLSKSKYVMKAYLSDIREIGIDSSDKVEVYGSVPVSYSRTVHGVNYTRDPRVDVIHENHEYYVRFGTVISHPQESTYDWDFSSADNLVKSLLVNDVTSSTIKNLENMDMVRILNNAFSVVTEYCNSDGYFTGRIFDVQLNPQYLRSLGINEKTPNDLAVITLESNLQALGVESILLEYSNKIKTKNSNEVLAKWLVRYSLGKKFNDVFKTFANQVMPSKPMFKPNLPSPSAHRELPPVYQEVGRKAGWWK